LLICTPATALIYKHIIKTNQNKIRMEVEHSRKKEVILFDFNQVAIWKKQLEDKQPICVDKFDRLINKLKRYQHIGFKKYEPSLFKSSDKQIVAVYKSLQKINTILKKISASIIIEEKHSVSAQMKNILSDLMIYTPQFIGDPIALVCLTTYYRKTSYMFVKNGFVDYVLAFAIGSNLNKIIPSYMVSALIAYARHK
jgi:hypothetical protein